MTGKPYRSNPWQRRVATAQPPMQAKSPAITNPNPPYDMTRLPLGQRLRIADDYAAAHPGCPIATMLTELFPELKGIGASCDLLP